MLFHQTDKQFYLDQAKQLKENFNSKYPDYVYRRRPNNSRKKRKTDPLGRPDAGELGDDMSPLGDFSEPSPSDASDSPQDAFDLAIPRTLGSHFESGVGSGHTRLSTFPFSSSHGASHSERLGSFNDHHHHRGLGHSASASRLTQNSYPPYGLSQSALYNNDHAHSHHGPGHPYSANGTSGGHPSWLSDRPAPSPKSYSPTSYSPSSAPSPTGSAQYPFPNIPSNFFPGSGNTNTYPGTGSGTSGASFEGRQFTSSPALRDESGAYPRPGPRALPPLSNLTSASAGGIPPIEAGFQWNRERIDT